MHPSQRRRMTRSGVVVVVVVVVPAGEDEGEAEELLEVYKREGEKSPDE
jgi:hypothetical protein